MTKKASNKTLNVFISAGEPSGDFLGAKLMAALKKKLGEENIKFIGVGGELMQAEGLVSEFPMKELSLMGLVEVLPHLLHLRRRLLELVKKISETKPDILITIDSPGFHLPLAKKVRQLQAKGLKIPALHYAAPTVWAWKPKRAAKMAAIFDHVLTLLPFEPPYFQREGLPATFVGHPLTELSIRDVSGESFKVRHNISEDKLVLCLLPGSRSAELASLLPVFSQLARLLAERYKNLHIVIPTLEQLKSKICEAVASWPVPVTVITGREEKYEAFKASKAAVAASGTITLELALAGLPMVVTYRVNRVTAWMIRRLIKVQFVALVNILLKRHSVPELLQDECKSKKIAEILTYLLEDTPVRQTQLKDLKDVAALITSGRTPPSEQAAEIVLKVIKDG